MPRNIEIKASVRDFASLVQALTQLSADPATHLSQEDTFFACPSGRLKLRKFSATSGELIYYRRANEPGPKESSYICVPTLEPDLLRRVLASAHGTIGIVRKRRTVYIVGRTRVHLDDVEGLGKFAELEVTLADSESADTGVREARHLMAALGIRDAELVSEAYIDLLRANQGDRAV